MAAAGVLLVLLLGTLVHARHAATRTESAARESRTLVARLGLTDLALFTEARYTRHPTQADLHSAFQDHPGALEHFPSGSLLGPPRALLDHHGRLARATEISD
jgi:hypothetical protein